MDELGVEPGRELRDLQAGILDADPGLAAPGPALARFLAAPPAPEPGESGLRDAAGQAPSEAEHAAGRGPARLPGPAPAGSASADGRPGGHASAGQAAEAQVRPMAGGAAAGGAAPGGAAPGGAAAGGAAGGTRVARAGTDRGHPGSRAAVAKSSPTVGAGPPRPGRAGAASESQAAVVPRQLPAGVAHFAGRTAELAELQTWQHEAASADGTAKVLVIGGTAGAGKTALVVHWAHHSAGEFPDGQLYVNLRGFDASGTPVTPGDALRWFLGAFGVTEEQIPDSIDAQSALYRSVLAGKRVLVILDNARDAAQVRPLLPGSRSCLALVTSRARLPGWPRRKVPGWSRSMC